MRIYSKTWHKSWRDNHRDWIKEYQKRWKEKLKNDPERYTKYNKRLHEYKKSYWKELKNDPERYTRYRERARAGQRSRNTIINTRQRESNKNNKQKLFDLLGNRCSDINCLVPDGCNDPRCLQFDHVNGDGHKDKLRFRTTNIMIKYYLNHVDEARTNLQLLCANCNWIKRHENNESGGYSRLFIRPD